MSGKKEETDIKTRDHTSDDGNILGALVLFGTVMIVMFFVFLGIYGRIWKISSRIPFRIIRQNAVYPGRSCNDPSQFYTAGFF